MIERDEERERLVAEQKAAGDALDRAYNEWIELRAAYCRVVMALSQYDRRKGKAP